MRGNTRPPITYRTDEGRGVKEGLQNEHVQIRREAEKGVKSWGRNLPVPLIPLTLRSEVRGVFTFTAYLPFRLRA